MKFKIYTAAHSYIPHEAGKLQKIGFKLKQKELKDEHSAYTIVDGVRVGLFYKTNDSEPVELEFNNLNELKKFGLEFGELIIDFKTNKIQIYDDYIE